MSRTRKVVSALLHRYDRIREYGEGVIADLDRDDRAALHVARRIESECSDAGLTFLAMRVRLAVVRYKARKGWRAH